VSKVRFLRASEARPTTVPAAIVLLVEDDPTLVDALAPYLSQRGWELQWTRTVPEARAALGAKRPDVVLLDRGLPGPSGDTLTSVLLATNVPFIMLTARDAENERLTGFDLGADDYVTKPFSCLELTRRIDVVLRRRGRPRVPIDERTELDREGRLVRVSGRDAGLTPSEFDLISTLAARRGRVYSRTELVELLRLDLNSSERALDSHVKNVRRKLRDAGGDDRLIETVVGTGYVMRLAR
jgi:two-component system response regulator BaeR